MREGTDVQSLRVTQVRWEAQGVIAVSFGSPEGLDLPPWEPGAHLEVTLPSGLTRQYSLCGDPANRHEYTVAVLREEGGRGGSMEAHDVGLVGRVLRVRGPRNHFKLVEAASYLLVAGGIGITPLLAMARELALHGHNWRLVYGGRQLDSMAFRDELEKLAESGDAEVRFVPENTDGKLDIPGMLDENPDAAIFACGPPGLLKALEAEALARGRAVHLERFAADPAKQATKTATAFEFEVELVRTGQTLTVPPDKSILDVVREVIPAMPSSCEEGFCGSCETKVLAGIPEHNDEILTESDRAANNVMFICVSRSRTEHLELDL